MQVKVSFKKRIIIFLGAGASAPFDYPTTKSFLEKLGHNIFNEERKLLNSIRNLHWTIEDVEHIVQVLDLFLDMEDISKKAKLSSFFYKYPCLIDFTEKEKNLIFSPTINQATAWKETVEIARKLRDRIEEFTFEQYESKALKIPEIVKTYDNFFTMLTHQKKHTERTHRTTFDIFTTNYDNVIEDYCNETKKYYKLTALDYDITPPVSAKDEQYNITKLHGSLNWLIDKRTNEIIVSNTQHRVTKNSERWKRNEYILFGTKTRIGEELYKNLFGNFEKSLLNTKVCIVVGFSFRDEHINEIFNKALRKNKSLRVMIVSKGPKGVAKNLVKKEQILKKFNSRGVNCSLFNNFSHISL